MSKTLSSVVKAEFDSEVQHAFQGSSILAPTVTLRNNIVGKTYDFRRMGKGQAQQRGAPQTDVTPMDVSHSLIQCTLTDWVAPEYSDIFDQQKVNFDEMQELAFTVASAMGRRKDQIIIDALIAASGLAGTVGTDVGGVGTGMNLAKLRRAIKHLTDTGAISRGASMNGNGANDLTIVAQASQLEDILGDSSATSADFNAVRLLMNGDIKSWMGMNWCILDDRSAEEGGLDVATTVRDCFVYSKRAVGMAVGIDIKTEVNYIAQKTSWLINGLFSAGAVSRDGEGIVKIQCTES